MMAPERLNREAQSRSYEYAAQSTVSSTLRSASKDHAAEAKMFNVSKECDSILSEIAPLTYVA